MCPTHRTRLFSFAILTSSYDSSVFSVSGFSTSTFFPCLRNLRPLRNGCRWVCRHGPLKEKGRTRVLDIPSYTQCLRRIPVGTEPATGGSCRLLNVAGSARWLVLYRVSP